MKPAIRVANLAKSYCLGSHNSGGYRTLRETIVDTAAAAWQGLRGRLGTPNNGAANAAVKDKTFWALKDVSFEVQPGEVVGIIGRNGAGKSTLLKILSRITEPTAGRCEVRGRIASLLEVGTGFHPELSGRENIFLNGSLLGMSRKEITRKFDEIVAFSEIEQFIDTPVKRYSSGMYVRLAFAVAAHLEPEILVVDEVLAVGDVGFQEKCMGKMKDVGKQGRTVLFVSHNMQAVAQLTNRCVFMEKGQKADEGPTVRVLRSYQASLRKKQNKEGTYNADLPLARNGIVSAKVCVSEDVNTHLWGKPIIFEFNLQIVKPAQDLCFSFQVLDEIDRPVCHFWVFDSSSPFRKEPGVFRLQCHVPCLRLFMGSYSLTTWLSERRTNHLLENLSGICPFEVTMLGVKRPEYEWTRGDCVYLEDNNWSITKVEPDHHSVRT